MHTLPHSRAWPRVFSRLKGKKRLQGGVQDGGKILEVRALAVL